MGRRKTDLPGLFDATVFDEDPDDGLLCGVGPSPLYTWESITSYAGNLQLRDYQAEAVSATEAELEIYNATQIVSATGTGKTVKACHLILGWVQRGHKVLFLANGGDVLVNQTVEKLKRVLGGRYLVQREVSSWYATSPKEGKGADVVVASKDTFWNTDRLERFPHNYFTRAITDECHHAHRSNVTYNTIYVYLGIGRINKFGHLCKHVGLTATPKRHDGKQMSQTFDSVSYCYDIPRAVADGWLVDIVSEFVTITGYDISKVQQTIGKDGEKDIDIRQVSHVLEQEKPLHGIVQATVDISLQKGERRPSLIFASSVDHSRKMAEIFNRHRPGSAAHIDGMTKRKEKGNILKRFYEGDIQYLCNYGVLTEGYDNDRIRIVVPARPTESEMLFTQMVGRGTRPDDKIIDQLNAAPTAEQRKQIIRTSVKPALVVLDPIGITGKHKLRTSVDLLGGWYDPEVVRMVKRQITRNPGKKFDVQRELELARLAKERHEEEKRKKLIVDVSYMTRQIDIFDESDQTAQRKSTGLTTLSEAQEDLLTRFGYSRRELEGVSKKQASQLIGEAFQRQKQGLCTLRQQRILKKYGYKYEDVSYKLASAVITKLEKNGWKPLPVGDVEESLNANSQRSVCDQGSDTPGTSGAQIDATR